MPFRKKKSCYYQCKSRPKASMNNKFYMTNISDRFKINNTDKSPPK